MSSCETAWLRVRSWWRKYIFRTFETLTYTYKHRETAVKENLMVKCQRAANASVHWHKPSLSLFLTDSQWQLSWDRQSGTGGRCCRLLERLPSCSPLPLCLSVHFAALLCTSVVYKPNSQKWPKTENASYSNYKLIAVICSPIVSPVSSSTDKCSAFIPSDQCSSINGGCGYFCYSKMAIINRLKSFQLLPC